MTDRILPPVNPDVFYEDTDTKTMLKALKFLKANYITGGTGPGSDRISEIEDELWYRRTCVLPMRIASPCPGCGRDMNKVGKKCGGDGIMCLRCAGQGRGKKGRR